MMMMIAPCTGIAPGIGVFGTFVRGRNRTTPYHTNTTVTVHYTNITTIPFPIIYTTSTTTVGIVTNTTTTPTGCRRFE